MACPRNSITYNTTLCACSPGYLLNATANACTLFTANTTISTDSGVDYYAITFPNSVFSFDSIKKFTQSQAVFLEATVVLLLSWLIFCSFLRFMKLGDGNNVWFQLRWWISRLDICFATKHWLEDQRVVKKRKTELGGTLSIASWILFTGLFSALLYQIITKRSIEVHNVRAVNAPDLAAFSNDMEFNITTVSSMTCANLRNLGKLVTGSAGFLNYRVIPLTSFANFSCHNTSEGPTITLRCSGCRMTQDNLYISWEFVDLPNSPATAVGYKFNLSSKPHGIKKHLSFVSGTLRNGSTDDDDDDRPVTYRGSDPNILKFNLFPRIYHNLHDLRLIQPLLHDFVPGSFYDDSSQLQASLENTSGLVNTTLYVNFLSSYIVEIDKENILGPVSFLADLGGLYCISIGIFYYLLVQFEFRVKKLRNEDSVLRKIRNRRKAQERWNKLRKYVRYRWTCRVLDEDPENYAGSHCIDCIHGSGSLHSTKSSKRKRQRTASIGLNKKENTPTGEIVIPEHASLQHVKTCDAEGGAASPNETHPEDKLHGEITSQCQVPYTMDITIPPPPSLELLKPGSETEMADIQRSLTLLYEYNLVMREKLVATQSLLHDLANDKSQEQSWKV